MKDVLNRNEGSFCGTVLDGVQGSIFVAAFEAGGSRTGCEVGGSKDQGFPREPTLKGGLYILTRLEGLQFHPRVTPRTLLRVNLRRRPRHWFRMRV